MASDRDDEQAEARASESRQGGYATAVKYDARKRRVVIQMSTGISVHVPSKIVEVLADAHASDLSEIEITPAGLGLHWPRLDVDLYVPGLLQGIVGTRKWMATQLGQVGGAVRSAKKSAASVSNGKKGGRPRKIAPAA